MQHDQSKEKGILKEVAKKQLEVHHSDINQKTIALWKRHNAGRGERPVIHMEILHFTDEVLGPKLQCTDPMARRIEKKLYYNFFNMTEFHDDFVTPDYFAVHWDRWFKPFGYDIGVVKAADNGLAYQSIHPIKQLKEEYESLKPSTFGVNGETTREYFNAALDAIGDVIPVRMVMPSLIAWLTQDLVHLMGMEPLLNMATNGKIVSGTLEKLSDDYLRYFEYLEQSGYLLPTTGFEEVNQGSLQFTEELPSDGPVTVGQVWGHMDSQETVCVSPKMFGKLVWPHYKKVAEKFGLLSYGCCEPVNKVWQYLKELPNLRKASISPWADEAAVGEMLAGTKVTYHRKPSPNYIGVDEVLDENAWREHVATTIVAAKKCTLEFTIRDVYTIHNNIPNVQKAINIFREEVANRWNA